MSPQRSTAVCRRCGACCRRGGPALHRDDAPLLRRGVLAPSRLVTLRRGDWVRDAVAGGLGPAEAELVKARPGPDGTGCVFYHEGEGCVIHDVKPAECRALFCDAPEALAAMYRRDRLTRRDILSPNSALAALCAQHEAETDLVRLDALCRRAAGGDGAARAEVVRILRLDAAYRELLVERAGVPAGDIPFYLGRPPGTALPSCRAALAPGGLYRPLASAARETTPDESGAGRTP